MYDDVKKALTNSVIYDIYAKKLGDGIVVADTEYKFICPFRGRTEFFAAGCVLSDNRRLAFSKMGVWVRSDWNERYSCLYGHSAV